MSSSKTVVRVSLIDPNHKASQGPAVTMEAEEAEGLIKQGLARLREPAPKPEPPR